MASNDITDFVLEIGSMGVDGETASSNSCCPTMKTGDVYSRGNARHDSITICVRNCQCGIFDKNKCMEVLRKTFLIKNPFTY